MGEYAMSGGSRVKIGTCEDMYYLRFDQREKVQHVPGNVDPNGEDVYALRFRFPWPDEDHVAPGGEEFSDNGYHRAIAVHGLKPAEGVEHYSVQFAAQVGYLVSLPCPEGPDALQHLPIHRNGFAGPVQLVAQKLLRDGRLVPVCRCGGCGAMYRMEHQADIEALAVAFRGEADRREREGAHNGTGAADRRFWDAIADRILQGADILADNPPPACAAGLRRIGNSDFEGWADTIDEDEDA